MICGQSLRSLALELNKRGVLPVKGKRWSSAHLGKMLVRARLAGVREHWGKPVAKGQWPAILDKETHEAVKAVLQDPSRCSGGSGRRGPVPTSLGTGIYVCGVCHEPRLRLGRSNARRAVYKCGNIDTSSRQGHVTRVAEPLDMYITDVLLRKLSEPGVIDAICATFDNDDAERAALIKERDTINREIKGLAARCDAREIGDEEFVIATRRRRIRRDEITTELNIGGRRSAEAFREHPDEPVERVWNDYLTLGIQRAILAEVLTVTVQPTNRRGGRAPDGSYFNAASVDIALTERVAAAKRGRRRTLRPERVQVQWK